MKRSSHFKARMLLLAVTIFSVVRFGWHFLHPVPNKAETKLLVGNITVNSLESNTNDDGLCTLYEAIQAANNDAPYNPNDGDDCPAGDGADLITFSVSGIIVLHETLNINTEIAIIGPIAISGDDSTRIFQVSTNGNLNLSTLTLQNGKTGGGAAINNSNGKVNIAGVTFINNHGASGGDLNLAREQFHHQFNGLLGWKNAPQHLYQFNPTNRRY